MSSFLIEDVPSIETRLEELSSCHLSSANFTKFLYIRALNDRANKQYQSKIADKLVSKALLALNELDASLEQQFIEAKDQLNIIEETYGHAYDEAKLLFDSYSYTALKKLFETVQQKSSSDHFKELITEIGRSELSMVSASSVDSSEKLTRQTVKKTDSNELQSFGQYQAMFEKMALDRLLARVMKEIPENAGPLNPERLVIRSFKALQDISPDYLSHLISYYESLLVLQLLNTTDK